MTLDFPLVYLMKIYPIFLPNFHGKMHNFCDVYDRRTDKQTDASIVTITALGICQSTVKN